MSEQMQGGMTAIAHSNGAVAEGSTHKPNSIRYWTSIAGQDQIDSFDGWAGSTALSYWLSQRHPRLYGHDAGPNNLEGQKNRGVAAFVQVTELMHGPDSEAGRTLAAALDEFARSVSPDH